MKPSDVVSQILLVQLATFRLEYEEDYDYKFCALDMSSTF